VAGHQGIKNEMRDGEEERKEMQEELTKEGNKAEAWEWS
jgi:hypothetical protein